MSSPGQSAQLVPMSPYIAQPDVPMTGALAGTLASQTESLWLKTSWNTHSWHWPDPETAPYAEVVADDTDYTFQIGDGSPSCDFQIPWILTAGFDRLEVFLVMAFPWERQGMTVQVTTDDLVSAVATANSNRFPFPMSRGSPAGMWSRAAVNYILCPTKPEVTPTLAADRGCTIRFIARYAPISDDMLSSSWQQTLRLYSVRVRDIATVWDPGI